MIKNLPAPTSVKRVKSFVGACSYYRSLVPDFSKTAEDLIKLTRKHVKFHWGQDQEIAFNQLKDVLVSREVMATPQLDKPYKLYTDACGYAVGGILVQDDKNGVERVIQYVSHSLSTTQRKWSVSELEGYAIVYCINKLRPYLYGASFTVFTDHLFTKEMQNARIQRWGVLLQEYGAKIEYTSSSSNIRADVISYYTYRSRGSN